MRKLYVFTIALTSTEGEDKQQFLIQSTKAVNSTFKLLHIVIGFENAVTQQSNSFGHCILAVAGMGESFVDPLSHQVVGLAKKETLPKTNLFLGLNKKNVISKTWWPKRGLPSNGTYRHELWAEIFWKLVRTCMEVAQLAYLSLAVD